MRYITIIIFFLFVLFATPVHAAVVINEVFPKITDPAQNWVELFNTGSESVSLNQWKLDHTAGDAKSFILNASMNIGAHSFLTLTGSQTAITFSTEGDTVRLFDASNAKIDSQTYPGTLGYNTSMGRSVDGDGVWAICTTATFNTNNNCPQPSPTATPVPTSTPTPIPTPTPFPTPTIQPQTFGSLIPSPTTSQVLGVTAAPTPTPTKQPDVLQVNLSKTTIALLSLGIAAAALSYMLYLWLRHRATIKS